MVLGQEYLKQVEWEDNQLRFIRFKHNLISLIFQSFIKDREELWIAILGILDDEKKNFGKYTAACVPPIEYYEGNKSND